MAEFFYNMSLGFTYDKAIAPMMKPYDKRFGDDKVFTHIVPMTNRPNSKQRYFSISTDDVEEYSATGNPIIKGSINGYNNLKSSINYYVYVFDKNKKFNPEEITKNGKKVYLKIEKDGTFTYNYSDIKITEFPIEYQFVFGFEYHGITYYGPIKTLKTKGLCPNGNHPHLIDLGLPSGTKWACCNVGATTPEEYGDYYAWGETKEKTQYTFETYQHKEKNDYDYWVYKDIGSDISGTKYDIAHKKSGGSCVMPSTITIAEMMNNCSKFKYSLNGIDGFICIGDNGGCIFLPGTGERTDTGLNDIGIPFYWSSEHSKTEGRLYSYMGYAIYLIIPYHPEFRDGNRYCGLTIRPVSR